MKYLLSLLLLPVLAHANPAELPHRWQLEKVVEVSRHGVRPPVAWDLREMEKGTGHAWPAWNTPAGELTGHGYTAAWLKGRVEAEHYRQLGLITSGCPSSRDIYVYASPLQRTRETAKALAEGGFPDCTLPVHFQQSGNDPLFLTGDEKVTQDPQQAREAVLQALGGSVEVAQRRWQPQIDRLAKAACLPDHPCPLFKAPWELKISDSGAVSMPALDHQAAIAEALRLAWSENKPAQEVAPAGVKRVADLTPLLQLNSVKYDFTNDVDYIAQRQGSRLMAQILQALDPQQHTTPDTRWLLLVAHDNNIAYLRTLLNFHWRQAGYPHGSIPPAGSLVFERWRDSKNGKRYLRVLFRSQSLNQIRYLIPLNRVGDLLQSEYQAPGCFRAAPGLLCPLSSSLQRVSARLDNSVITPFSWPTP